MTILFFSAVTRTYYIVVFFGSAGTERKREKKRFEKERDREKECTYVSAKRFCRKGKRETREREKKKKGVRASERGKKKERMPARVWWKEVVMKHPWRRLGQFSQSLAMRACKSALKRSRRQYNAICIPNKAL